jgi:hypothetical protein
LLLFLLGLSACTASTKDHSHARSAATAKTTPKKAKQAAKTKQQIATKPKHYPGFSLDTVPQQFCGTWYRANQYDKKATKLVISAHAVNGLTVYQQTDPDLKLDKNSPKQTKEYAGLAAVITISANQLKVRVFFDTVDLIYTLGQFKGQACLYLTYGTNPKAINGAIFKDKQTALKYRQYDFSQNHLTN